MAYDDARQEIVLFGGSNNDAAGNAAQNLTDTWVWNGQSWLQRTPANSPPQMGGVAMAYDARRGETVLVGNGPGATRETWVWNGSNWLRKAQILPTMFQFAMVYNPTTETVVLTGTRNVTGASLETWTWDGNTWAQRFPTVSPPPRVGHGMTYDVARREVLLFGGTDPLAGGSVILTDTWVWDGSNWIQRSTTRAPSGSWGAALTYAPSIHATVYVAVGRT
jgi:hypothetical protein